MPLTARPSNYNLRSVEAADQRVEVQVEHQPGPQEVIVPLVSNSDWNMASLRLEQFTGERNSNIVSFLRRFKDYCAVTKLNDEQQLATLRWHLGGVARLWYESLTTEPTTVKDLSDKLEAKFKIVRSVDIGIFSMKQSPGESVENFLDRLETATYHYQIDDKLQVQIALSGMDSSVGTAISTHAPNSLTVVRQLARMVCSVPSVHTNITSPMVAHAEPVQSKMETTMDVIVAAMKQLTSTMEKKESDDRPSQEKECNRCGVSVTGMVMFFIWILCATSVSGMELHRLNYGVVFEKEAKLQLDAEMWIHTFEIQLPEVTNLKKLTGCKSYSKTCDLVRDVMLEINQIKHETESMINNTVEAISNLIPERNLLVKSRSRRALLPFIGDLSKTIFGTATYKDVEILARHINKLNKLSREVVKSVEQHENDLASYIQTADARMTNLMAGIKENEIAITDMQQLLQKSIHNLEKSFSTLSVLIAEEVQKSRQLESVFGTLLNGIYDLVEGKLSPYLIDPSTMEKTVYDIKGILNSKFNGFHLVYHNPKDIYENVQSLYVRQASKLYISVKFPISHFPDALTLYKIQSFPVPVNSTSNHATQLLDLPDYIAITRDMSYYATFQRHELSECVSNKLMVCKFGKVLTPYSRKSCALSLFQDDKLLVKSQCDFRFLVNHLESRIIPLSLGSLLVYNIDVLEFDCKSGRKEVQGCKFCILHVSCACSVSTVDMYLPPRLTKCHKNTTTKLHPVNLALLQSFFNDSSLENVESSTLFKTILPVDVPQFQLYNHSMSNIIANDRQSHLSLEKMAQSAKKQATCMIFQSLTEPLLSGDISLEDSWPSTNDIILYITTAVAGISLLTCIFLALKLRKLLIMMAVLQKASMKQVYAATVPSFVYKNSESTPAPNTYFWESLNIELEHVIIGLEICIILLVVALFVYFRKFRTDKTQIVCEITNGESCVHISLKELSLCPTYWKITVPQNISNITIQGLLAPILTFQWDKLEITNTLTEQSVILKTQFRVNSFHAKQLKNIMAAPYCVYFYIQHKRLLIPLK